MSQQLQITGGAKVRSLEGVITGSTGVLGSLPINGSNGIPQLDVNGKILVSQLPNSVMEYLGTWNAATNTPTLVNGTGNAGDVYLCNVAGTVNFGAGPITFGVGDQVIYSGTIWQKAGGSTGTVTSVAVTETGDALSITGSPITTSGTINIGFAGTSAQYVAGDGTLVTFPTFSGFVPYTGATANVDLGTFDLTTDIVNLNQLKAIGSGGLNIYSNSGTHIALMGGGGGAGTTFYGGIIGTTASFTSSGSSNTFDITHSSGSGIALNITKGGSGEGLYINKTSGSGNALTVLGTTSISGQLTLGSTITNGTYTYTLPGATGVLALTSDLTIYVTLGTLQTITGTKIYSSLQYFDNNVYIKHGISGSSSGYTTLGANASGLNINLASGTSNNSLNFASTSASNTYTFPNATGTIALTSDLSSYVPTSRTLTINGTTYDLSADRSWTVSGSQWTTSGSDIYYNTGNVGINQSSPTFKLDVNGTGRYTGKLTIGNFDGEALKLQLGTSTGNSYLRFYSSGGSGLGYIGSFDSGGTQYLLVDGSGTDLTLNGNSILKLNTGGTERMRITSSGNVGIGTTNPFAILTSAAPTTGAIGLGIIGRASDNYGLITYRQNDGTTTYLEIGGSPSSGLFFNNYANIHTSFATNSTERMRITSGGSVGIGTSDPFGQNSSLLALSGSGATYNFFSIKDTVNQSGACYIQFLNSSGGGTGQIVRIGTTNAVAYNTTSDYRLKEDLKEINGLDKISKIKVYDFKWKDNEARMDGVLAHELEQIIPFAVTGKKDAINKDGSIKTQGVDYSKLVPVLVKAIQELKLQIDELKNK